MMKILELWLLDFGDISLLEAGPAVVWVQKDKHPRPRETGLETPVLKTEPSSRSSWIDAGKLGAFGVSQKQFTNWGSQGWRYHWALGSLALCPTLLKFIFIAVSGKCHTGSAIRDCQSPFYTSQKLAEDLSAGMVPRTCGWLGSRWVGPRLLFLLSLCGPWCGTGHFTGAYRKLSRDKALAGSDRIPGLSSWLGAAPSGPSLRQDLPGL